MDKEICEKEIGRLESEQQQIMLEKLEIENSYKEKIKLQNRDLEGCNKKIEEKINEETKPQRTNLENKKKLLKDEIDLKMFPIRNDVKKVISEKLKIEKEISTNRERIWETERNPKKMKIEKAFIIRKCKRNILKDNKQLQILHKSIKGLETKKTEEETKMMKEFEQKVKPDEDQLERLNSQIEKVAKEEMRPRIEAIKKNINELNEKRDKELGPLDEKMNNLRDQKEEWEEKCGKTDTSWTHH